MARRDARRGWRALLFCAAAIAGGVAVLVAVAAFAANLRRAVDDKTRALLGADLRVSSREPFSAKAEAWMKTIPGQQARETTLLTMGTFPRANAARLVQVRALTGGFPFYGAMETVPEGLKPQDFKEPVALIEEGLGSQLDLKPGDPMKLGSVEFKIAGVVRRAPGETEFTGTFAPRVYISGEWLARTGLMGGLGNMASYTAHFEMPAPPSEAWLEAAQQKFGDEERLRFETVEMRRRSLGQAIDNLQGFFSLVGCMSLLLGGLGIAGAAQVYVRERLDGLAVLRCLGATARQGFGILLVQVAAAGLAGAVAGVALGAFAQSLLPSLLHEYLPVDVTFSLSWPSVILGVVTGVVASSLFALPPLLEVRRATPLRALRAGFDDEAPPSDWTRRVLPVLLALVVAGYCSALAAQPEDGLWFATGLGAALAVLGVLAWGLRKLARRLAGGRGLGFVTRQGLANLDRPRNRTGLLTAVLGLGVFLLYTLWLVEAMLLSQGEFLERGSEPDLFFFDIQPEQVAGLQTLLETHHLELNEETPVVSMRLQSVKGRTLAQIRNDKRDRAPGWLLGHEFRSTYRDHLTTTETLVSGTFTPRYAGNGPIPISVEEGAAQDLGVKVGDPLVFDVQGVTMNAVVGSIRRVDWQRFRPNFFLIFPAGVLEDAPAWSLAVARAGDAKLRGQILREVAEKFPNISVIDLGLVIATLTDILDRASFAMRFLALFTVATGVLVIFGTIWTGRHQRRRESALLRALGASARTMRGIWRVEYALVGVFGGAAGSVLAVGAAWALGKYWFQIALPWGTAGWSLPVAVGLASATSLLAGLAASRGLASHSPLEVLRAE
ncbi:MAG: FtsX-like permease family protein [Opitutales bacterium]